MRVPFERLASSRNEEDRFLGGIVARPLARVDPSVGDRFFRGRAARNHLDAAQIDVVGQSPHRTDEPDNRDPKNESG